MDLPHSDDRFVVAFPAEPTEAFLEGHVQAFAYFGGVWTETSAFYSSMRKNANGLE
jgi:transposase